MNLPQQIDYEEVRRRLITEGMQSKDIHRDTAALIFDVPPAKVTDVMRRLGKRVNFYVAYGYGEALCG